MGKRESGTTKGTAARRRSRPLRRALGIVSAMLVAAVLVPWWIMIRMPGESAVAPLAELTPAEAVYVNMLEADVQRLAADIGERHVGRRAALDRAAEYLFAELTTAGWDVVREEFTAGASTFTNLVAERRGSRHPDEIVIVGAHYDTARGTPGANDNGSGVAVLLALARTLSREMPARTLRLVCFANEEPPWFQTDGMGSVAHARACRAAGEDVVAMISLETMGCFLDEPGTQSYPPPLSFFYPDRGDFLAVVGGVGSRDLVRRIVSRMRQMASLPIEGAALPLSVPGVGWSDHWSFAREGYPAVMFTDTAPFRYPHYHRAGDLPDQVDTEGLARATYGLMVVVLDLLRD